jgi:glucosamine kinase
MNNVTQFLIKKPEQIRGNKFLPPLDDQVPKYLAADCGGTHCRVRIYASNHNLLAEGKAGPANASLGLEVMLSSIIEASERALHEISVPNDDLSSLSAGLAVAGLVNDNLRNGFETIPHPFKSLRAETDAFVARLGAFGLDDGALLITGTGSCGFGVVNNQSFYVGGWGFAISDQGSGARLGSLAIRRAVQAFDQIRPSSPLCNEILNSLGGDAASAHHWAIAAKPSDYAHFSKLVFDHAEQRDPVAVKLLTVIAEEIDELISTMLKKGITKLCHMGGISVPIKPYLSPASLRHIVKPKGDTFDGAIQLIEENLGLLNTYSKVR